MPTATTEARPRPARLAGLDRLRGLVMVLMALDHARDFFSLYPYSPTDLDHASVALFLTRWITHFCAPVFMLLAGASAWLHARNQGLDRAALARFLALRGLWLIALELSWNNLMWHFSLDGLTLQVLWALGASMLILAAALWLPRPLLIGLALLLIGGHDRFDAVRATDLGAPGSMPWLVWVLLHQPAVGHTASGFRLALLYPLVPWCAVMMLGYAAAPVLAQPAAQRDRRLVAAGLALIGLFLGLRLGHGYGDPQVWHAQLRGWPYTVLAVFDVEKYPPSLQYLLMTLGPALVLLPLLSDAQGGWTERLSVFGRVPLFFYLLHIPLIHGLSGLAVRLRFGAAAAAAAVGPHSRLPGYEPSLLPVYAGWLLVLVALYPLCRAYADYKQRHRERAWLSYL